MNFSDLCEKYFGSKDLYEVLNISKTSSQKEVRKAYHKLSLSCHPDRVEEEQKDEANEKFKVLGKIHLILSDPEKRAIYDEAGVWTEGNEDMVLESRDWMDYWRSIFSKITISDINKYEEAYKGSKEEMEDLKDAYLKGKGDMDKMMQYILFHRPEEEDRIRAIILQLIDNGEVPHFDIFTNEPQAKRDRRMRKLKQEAKEAEKETEKLSDSFAELQKQIMARREETTTSFLDELEKKYAGPKMSSKTTKKSSRGKTKK